MDGQRPPAHPYSAAKASTSANDYLAKRSAVRWQSGLTPCMPCSFGRLR
jgi:hypothetical protein